MSGVRRVPGVGGARRVPGVGGARPVHGGARRPHGVGGPGAPSSWVVRWASLVPAGGRVLDVAAGGGRHTRWFLGRGHPVTAVDVDVSRLESHPQVEIVEADLEGGPWPFAGRTFAGVVVTNYLHRPLLPRLVDAVAEGGALLYETFMVGQERLGRPSNPAFLLRPGELRAAVEGALEVVAFEEGGIDDGGVLLPRGAGPPRAVVQRLAAVRPGAFTGA